MPGTHRNQIQAVQDRRRKIDRDLYSTVPRGVDTDRLALHPSAQGGAAYHTVQHRRRKTDGQTVMPLTGLPSDAHHRRAVGTYLSEDVTQGLSTCGQPAAGATTMCECVVDRRERERSGTA